MVSPIPKPPEVLYGAVGIAEELPSPAAAPQACVDCAAEGNADALRTIYTVQGTVLCLDHAVTERASQKENAK
jgi:hypothetical protein